MGTVSTLELPGFPSLQAALRLDMAEEELVQLLMDACGYMAQDFEGLPPHLEMLLARVRKDAADLRDHRVLADEYHRLITEDAEPGRVALRLIKLWITDSRTLDVRHRDGYKLSDFRGGAYLVPSGNDWEILYADRGYAECAHETPAAAADRLERLCKETRERLGRSYAALELLSREAAPQPKAKKR